MAKSVFYSNQIYHKVGARKGKTRAEIEAMGAKQKSKGNKSNKKQKKIVEMVKLKPWSKEWCTQYNVIYSKRRDENCLKIYKKR